MSLEATENPISGICSCPNTGRAEMSMLRAVWTRRARSKFLMSAIIAALVPELDLWNITATVSVLPTVPLTAMVTTPDSSNPLIVTCDSGPRPAGTVKLEPETAWSAFCRVRGGLVVDGTPLIAIFPVAKSNLAAANVSIVKNWVVALRMATTNVGCAVRTTLSDRTTLLNLRMLLGITSTVLAI